MQKNPVFPAVPTPVVDWLTPVKEYLAATGRPKWRAYTDGSWVPPPLSPLTMFATTYPGCRAGAGIVLSPDTEDWETAPYCCIEITDGASLGCQNAYMMEVLAAAVASQLTSWAPEIWTDCKALKTAYADPWATITGHKPHSLCFEALQRAKPILTWIKAHPEDRHDSDEDWSRDEWGNHYADRLAGACPMEVSASTHGRAVHFKVTARDALHSLLTPHQWYIGDPIRGPALSIGVETKAWQDYLTKRYEYSTRPAYWEDNTLPLAAIVFGMEHCSISYAAKKLRILYDKGWYGRHILKGIDNLEDQDIPEDSLCPLCGQPDSLRHWLSECQHSAMVECRRDILESLPHPQGDKASDIFTRAISALIPRLLANTSEPERVWTSNFTHSLRCRMWSMVPRDLESTPVDMARKGFIVTMGALAKGCHRLWVTRHSSNKRIGPKRIRHIVGDTEEEDVSESEEAWADNLFGEDPSQGSLDDEHTPLQEEDDEDQREGDLSGNKDLQEDGYINQVVEEAAQRRATRKRSNVDYRKRKTQKRHTHATIGYQEAIITGNPQSTTARVETGYDTVMGWSVYVKGAALHKGDYATHYAVKATLTAEEYADIYNNKNHVPTLEQRRDKDYIYRYSKTEYWIGDHEDRSCERGIAQFMNCATPGTEERNNCELVPFTRDSKKWLAAKVTELAVQVGEQLLTRYGGRKVVSTEYVNTEIPEGLDTTVTSSPPGSQGTVSTAYYGYSADRLWEVKLALRGSRLVKRRQIAQVRRLPEEAAITYLLALTADNFELKIKSTDILFSATEGDGTCGYRAIWQADQRARIPIGDRVGSPIDISYKVDED